MNANQQQKIPSEKRLIIAVLVVEVLLLAPWLLIAALGWMGFDSGFRWSVVSVVGPLWSYPVLLIVFGVTSIIYLKSGQVSRARLFAWAPIALPMAYYAVAYVVVVIASVLPSANYFEIKSAMEQECQAAKLKVYARPGEIKGLFIDDDVMRLNFSNIINGLSLDYGSSRPNRKSLMTDGVLEFYELHNSTSRMAKGEGVYQRVQHKAPGSGSRGEASNEIRSEYGLFHEAFEPRRIGKASVAGGKVLLIDLETEKTIAETTYYVNKRERFFCGDSIDRSFSGLSIVQQVFQNLDPQLPLTADPATPSSTPVGDSHCIILPKINGCADSRVILNGAIEEWEAGDIKSAETRFETLKAYFPGSSIAAESIEVRTRLKEKYRDAFSVKKARQQNNGEFSKQVVQSIESYYQKNEKYPDKLSRLNSFWNKENRKYRSSCTYKLALFDYGYQLDCVAADKVYSADKSAISEKLALKQKLATKDKKLKRKDQNLKKKPEAGQRKSLRKTRGARKSLSDFPKAKSTWGALYNPSGEIARHGYYAYYFDSNQPNRIIGQDTVDSITVNYSYDKFHKIKSQNFGAYWTGKIRLPRDEIKKIKIAQSWAQTRLIIDDRVVYEGNSKAEILLYLEQGDHRLEVEYINNWHTTRFSVVIEDFAENLTVSDIPLLLATKIPAGYEVHYAGLYQSSGQHQTTILNIAETAQNVVLVLSSYEPVKWYISNPFQTRLKAIIYSSSYPGSTLSGDIDKNTFTHTLENQAGSYSLESSCECVAGYFRCDEDFLSTRTRVERLTGVRLIGFSGAYSASSLRVPQTVVDEALLREQMSLKRKTDQLRAQCQS